MCQKVKTTKISGGADYAKVADRLLEFRSKNPRSKIAQKVDKDEDGNVTIKAYVWKDKGEYMELLKSGVSAEIALESADAEGSALATANEINKQKGYEKHETIAIGRALALLGYAASGEIASSEEMEEFEAFQKEKTEKEIAEAFTKIQGAKDIATLQKVWVKELTPELRGDKGLQDAKDARKEELLKPKEEKKAKEVKKEETNEGNKDSAK